MPEFSPLASGSQGSSRSAEKGRGFDARRARQGQGDGKKEFCKPANTKRLGKEVDAGGEWKKNPKDNETNLGVLFIGCLWTRQGPSGAQNHFRGHSQHNQSSCHAPPDHSLPTTKGKGVSWRGSPLENPQESLSAPCHATCQSLQHSQFWYWSEPCFSHWAPQLAASLTSHVQWKVCTLLMVLINKSTNNKCWWGCGEKGTRLHCQWECRYVQPLWKAVCSYLKKKLKMDLP